MRFLDARRGLGRERLAQAEGAAPSWLADHLDVGAVRAADGLDDGEAKTGAALLTRARGIDAI